MKNLKKGICTIFIVMSALIAFGAISVSAAISPDIQRNVDGTLRAVQQGDFLYALDTAAPGSTVTLTADEEYTYTSPSGTYYVIPNNVTIDLNGHTLTLNTVVLQVLNNNEIVITDNSINKNGQLISKVSAMQYAAAIVLSSNSRLDLRNITIQADLVNGVFMQASSLFVNDCTISASIAVNCVNGTAIINNSVLNTDGFSLYIEENSKTELNNCTVSSSYWTAVHSKNSDLEVKGGTIEATDGHGITLFESTANVADCEITAKSTGLHNKNGNVEITGSKITAEIGVNSTGDSSNTIVTDGTINAELGVRSGEGASANVKGTTIDAINSGIYAAEDSRSVEVTGATITAPVGVEVNGGDVKTENSTVNAETAVQSNGGSVTVSGVTSDSGEKIKVEYNGGEANISGDNVDVTGENGKVEQNPDGSWSVQQKTPVELAMEKAGLDISKEYRLDRISESAADKDKLLIEYTFTKNAETKVWSKSFDVRDINGDVSMGVLLYDIAGVEISRVVE